MTSRPLNTRYKNYTLYENKLHQPYDYERYGLIEKIVSNKLANTTNSILKVILSYYEKSFVFVMKYVDRLKHFKNYNWANR